ncbi:uridylyltransferase-like protein, putative [Bodo saltans]|uniref:RNA uridylyltransferase n=1 Tax=Bodo saltans TaxID=75058 RepID=A0A0S4IKN8_BODSA|nr:uridylyltransferase-like protein, putative [Bodo saltans]|eukprot:CUF11144.1 uridylyltransferase-like protein, putative [Bodo saltans]
MCCLSCCHFVKFRPLFFSLRLFAEVITLKSYLSISMSVSPSDRVECSLHKGAGLRPARFLDRLPSGEFRCREKDPCRVKPVAPVETDGDGNVVAPAKPIDTCDLCNQDIHDGSIDQHIMVSHGTLLKYCNTLVDQAPVMLSTTLSPNVVASLGQRVVSLAAKSDPGPEVFKFAVDARDQLEAILQTKFPKCNVYTFGSCVASGCWDGRGDVDFTIVDPIGSAVVLPLDAGMGAVMSTSPSLTQSVGTTGRGRELEKRKALSSQKRHDASVMLDSSTRSCNRCYEHAFPLVKHEIKDPIDADRLRNPSNRTIRFEITGQLSESDARTAERCFSTQCKCRWEGYGSKKSKLIVQFPSCAAALKEYMSPTNLMIPSKPKIVKKWARFGYRPSIYAIKFDLSARGFGVRNSFLLRAYLSQSPEIRCGSVFIKHWSKHSGVNYSMKGYITSYAVNLMWIYYLIVKGEVSFVDPQSILASMHDKRDFAYLPMRAAKGVSPQEFERKVGELVANFFKFYALEFDWKNDVVTVSRANLTTKQSLSWTEEKEVRSLVFRDRVWYRFCIEDPFEDNLNLARHISPIKLNKVRMEFLRAYECVLTNAPDRILLDRSAIAAKTTCVQLVFRSLAGEKSLPFVEVIRSICANGGEESLAAFEVEHSTDSIVKIAGLQLKGDAVSIPSGSEGKNLIPKDSRRHIDAIDQALASAPLVGVEVTTEYERSNFDKIYFYDQTTNRYFICEKDSLQMREYTKIVRRAVAAFADESAEEPTEAVFRELLREADINVDEGIFQTARKLLLSSVMEVTMANLAPKANNKNMVLSSKAVGTCEECRTKGVDTWPSYDKSDKGYYCLRCWDQY